MKLVFLLLFAAVLALAAPIQYPINAARPATRPPSQDIDTRHAQAGHAKYERLVAQYGAAFTGSPGLPLSAPLRRGAAPRTTVDIERELRRLGLAYLDLRNWDTEADHAAVVRQYGRVRALSRASSYRAKARALACVVALRDRPPPSLVWEYEWQIFYSEFLGVSATDPRARELAQYYYDRVRRVQRHAHAHAHAHAHGSVRARAAAVARVAALAAHPAHDLVAQLESDVGCGFASFYCGGVREWAREWARRGAAAATAYLAPMRGAWRAAAPYLTLVRTHTGALAAHLASYWVRL